MSALPAAAGEPMQFVVFSDDWGEHPSSCQHLFRTISARHAVIWVNTIGMRNPRISLVDLRKAWRKASRMLGTALNGRRAKAADSTAVTVLQPFMLPFSTLGVVRRFNGARVMRAVRAAMARQRIVAPVVLASVPNACDYLEGIEKRLVVYYCVDDFSEWPGLQRDMVRDMERDLVDRSDILVATSEKLLERLGTTGKPTYLLTHGVDLSLFSGKPAGEHRSLRDIPKPRVGYFGLFDERSDQELIAEVASRMPDVSFVIAGPVTTQVSRLERLKNICFTGPIAYHELPDFIAGMRALFLPYEANEFANALSPLKLNEYLATGKPIVSTPIAEARRREGYIAIARTAEEWEAVLSRAIDAETSSASAKLPALASESWESKADTLLGICREALLGVKSVGSG